VLFRAGVRKEVEMGLIDFDKSLRHALSHLCVIMYSRNMDFPLDAWFQHNGNMIVIGIHGKSVNPTQPGLLVDAGEFEVEECNS